MSATVREPAVEAILAVEVFSLVDGRMPPGATGKVSRRARAAWQRRDLRGKPLS